MYEPHFVITAIESIVAGGRSQRLRSRYDPPKSAHARVHAKVPLRIGDNSGLIHSSLDDEDKSVTPKAMVESGLPDQVLRRWS